MDTSISDVGVLDSDGFLRLTGRTKRIAKVFGLRVSLDEVEAAAGGYGGLVAAAASSGIAFRSRT